jgi:uncharacterized protein (DUF1800 family)
MDVPPQSPQTRIVAVAMLASAWCVRAAAAETPSEAVLWLNRVTYGADAATLARYRELGRRRYLDEQLEPSDRRLPADVAAQLARLAIADADASLPERQLTAVNAENQRINALTDDEAKQAARKIMNDRGNALAQEAARRHVLLAVYSPAQLEEQLVWFWLNHFSVFQGKGNIRWLVADYEWNAIRPRALGKFRELVLATLKHPAMLQYLDNAQNGGARINENYARELLELHTLGVDAGYTQHDVQELARVLTGAGINATDAAPQLKPEWQALYRREGAFEFNPARHDFGAKALLGKAIAPGGFDEIERAVDVLVAHPACARFVSRKLAEYFLGEPPSDKLVLELAKVFTRTDGDVAAVLRALFDSRELADSLGKQLKDPMHFVVSSLRLAYQGETIVNTRPVVNWLNALGEPLYGRQTPDGYPLDERSWASSGQMSKRFEIARAIGSGNAGLFDPEDDVDEKRAAFPQLATRFYFESIEGILSDRTRIALDEAVSQAEWNTYLLSSPELNYR